MRDDLLLGVNPCNSAFRVPDLLEIDDNRFLLYDTFSYDNKPELDKRLKTFFTGKPTLQDMLKGQHKEFANITLAYVDLNEKCIFLASDIRACYSLYYRLEEGFIAFSSNTYTLASLASFTISKENLYSRLILGYSLWDNTIIREIRHIQAGCAIYFKDNTLQQFRYHPLDEDLEPKKFLGLNIYKDALRDTIKPLNSFDKWALSLSGGLDSRLILSAILDSGLKPDLFLFGDDISSDCRIAKDIAANLNLKQEHIRVEDVFTGDMLESVWDHIELGEGNCDLDSLHSHIVYKMVKGRISCFIEGNYAGDPRLVLKPRTEGIFTKPEIFLSKIDIMRFKPFLLEDCSQVINDHVLPLLRDIPVFARNLPEFYFYEYHRRAKRVAQENYIERHYLELFNPLERNPWASMMLTLPEDWARDSKLFWALIKGNYRGLMRFPLDVGGLTVPFGYMRQSIFFYKGFERLRLSLGLQGKRRFPIYYNPMPDSLINVFISILEQARSIDDFRIDIDTFREKANKKTDLTPYLCFIPVLGWLYRLKSIKEYAILKK